MIDWMKSLYLFSDNLGDNLGDRFNNLFYKILFDYDKRLLLIDNKENKAKMIFERNIMINKFFGYAAEIEFYSNFDVKDVRCILDYFDIEYNIQEENIVFYDFCCYIDDDTADINVIANSIMDNNKLKEFIDFVIQKRIVNKIDYISYSLIKRFLMEFEIKCSNKEKVLIRN